MGFVRMDEDQFLELVRRLRVSLPADLEHAVRLTENSDRLWDSAQSEATRIIAEARTQAQGLIEDAQREADRVRASAEEASLQRKREAEAQAQMALDQSEITRIATAQAREIVAQTEAECRDLRSRADADAAATRSGADDYALEVLALLEQQVREATMGLDSRLNAALSAIERGRTVLENRRDQSGLPKLPQTRTAELMTGKR